MGEEALNKLCQYQASQCPKLLNKNNNTASLCEYSEILLIRRIHQANSKDISIRSSESVFMAVMGANSYIHASSDTMVNSALHNIVD